MTDYRVTYEKDEDGWWFASVDGLPGCYAQGKTVAQARERIREALGLFDEDADRARIIDTVVLPVQSPRSDD